MRSTELSPLTLYLTVSVTRRLVIALTSGA